MDRNASFPTIHTTLWTRIAYAADLADVSLSPEKLFERKLALEIINGAIKELESEAADEGKAAVFAAVRGHLSGEEESKGESYPAIAVRLNIPVGTLKSHTHHFRKRLRELMKSRACSWRLPRGKSHARMLSRSLLNGSLSDSNLRARICSSFREEAPERTAPHRRWDSSLRFLIV